MINLHYNNGAKKKYIETKTNKNSDILFKDLSFLKYKLQLIFCESNSDKDKINNFILRYLVEKKNHDKKETKDILKYFESNIPFSHSVRVTDYDKLFFLINSGFVVICIDGINEAIAFEVKSSLNSDVAPAQSESVIKGPKDAFTENYQTNLGMIKKRIKTEDLWIHEFEVGSLSKTKVGVLYINGIVREELVNAVISKINDIDIESTMDSNYIANFIEGNNNKVFPTSLSTERPDIVTTGLYDGKVVIMVENSQLLLVLPTLFFDFFQSTEDLYQKPMNSNYTRIIRLMAFIITILTPALYIAVTTYNQEAIPTKLLINLAMQREGVPLPPFLEALLMMVIFEVLKETDIRVPSVIGSSLSIVGAIVLGEAAVTAGLVSPMMVIVISITSISGFIVSSIDMVNSIRIWRLLFLIFASIAGIMGIMVSSLILIVNLTSTEILGIPYLLPLAPLSKKDIKGGILVSNKSRFFKRNTYLTKNVTRGDDD